MGKSQKGFKNCMKMEVLIAQPVQTLWYPMDCSLPGFSVHGFLQARILEQVAISFSRGSDPGIEPRSPALQADSLHSEPLGKPKNSRSEGKSLSRVRLLATPWTAALRPWDFPGKSTGVGCHRLSFERMGKQKNPGGQVT